MSAGLDGDVSARADGNPTSAWARAGASLMPSPTMPTTVPLVLKPLHLERLVLGQHLGDDPARCRPGAAIASAVRRLSPVIMTTSRPRLAKRARRRRWSPA